MTNSIIEKYLGGIPPLLAELVSKDWKEYELRCRSSGIEPVTDPRVMVFLVKVWCCSQFVSAWCIRRPNQWGDLVNSGDLFSSDVRNSFLENLQTSIDAVGSEEDLMAVLRRFRNRQMVRIAFRDIGGLADLTETLVDLSLVAEVCLQIAHDYLYRKACEQSGIPTLSDGRSQQLVILGMGKLGAYELNFSSDIDLIFAYQQDGALSDRRNTSYGEFFNRMGRKLIKVIDEVTVDGFVFRVDMRLRPFGESGPLVMSFDAMENYYQSQAREWERYAMIKARPVAGDKEAGEQLQQILRPFVYRRYLDYGAFSGLRELKSKITLELVKNESQKNIKLGPGGIREIEFIGQAFQLIRGGRDKELQERRILQVLAILRTLSLLPDQVVDRLTDAYIFLRTVENRLQQYADQQTHILPSNSEIQSRLIYSLGFERWADFKQALDTKCTYVQGVFEQVFESPQSTRHEGEALSVWYGNGKRSDLLDALASLGYTQTDEALDMISSYRNSRALRKLTAKGAETLDQLIPMVLAAAAGAEYPEDTLKRLLSLTEAVASRTAYLSLLVENPLALSQLVKLASASSWIVSYISRVPILLDELLDPRSLYAPLSKKALEKELIRRIKMNADDELEQQMTELRHFKQAQVLKVAAADIVGVIPLMVVSDYLTDIAEVILNQVVLLVWRMLAKKHGVPPGAAENEISGFGIIGYGKLGGLELGYGSDLDLVFLYDFENVESFTNGAKPIASVQFFVRLGQRIIHILSTNMFAGILYEIDMRLRPSGKSGLLVSSIEAYTRYLDNEAWTWEHQALVRARFVAGDFALANRFQEIRAHVLQKKRQGDGLKQDVSQMREKMRENLAVKDSRVFDVKHGEGGITDIEFIVQYTVLNFARIHDQLVLYTDNVHLLEQLCVEEILTKEEAAVLHKIYCEYRGLTHRFALQDRKALIPNDQLRDYRQSVCHVWDKLLACNCSA